MGRQKSTVRCFFVGVNTVMISTINFSGFFLVKHVSPVGNADGYYVGVLNKPVVPVTNQPIKL